MQRALVARVLVDGRLGFLNEQTSGRREGTEPNRMEADPKPFPQLQILFQAWVALSEQKWVILGERRSCQIEFLSPSRIEIPHRLGIMRRLSAVLGRCNSPACILIRFACIGSCSNCALRSLLSSERRKHHARLRSLEAENRRLTEVKRNGVCRHYSVLNATSIS